PPPSLPAATMGLFRELRYELSSLIFGLGILGMFFSLTQYLIPTQSPDWLQSIHRAVGDYVVWEALFGFLAVLGGGFCFVGRMRQDEMDFDRVRECARDGIPKRVESPSGPRRDDDRRPMEFQLGEDLDLRFDLVVIEEVGFRENRANRIGGDFREERAGRQTHLSLDLRLRIGDVHEEQDEVRLEDFLERRVERLDHPERHAGDDTDCVRAQDSVAR